MLGATRRHSRRLGQFRWAALCDDAEPLVVRSLLSTPSALRSHSQVTNQERHSIRELNFVKSDS